MRSASSVPVEWKKWIRENLMRGCDPKVLIQKMVEKHFDPVTAMTGVVTEAAKMGGTAADIEAWCRRAQEKVWLSAEWKRWVDDNIARGCTPKSLLQTMAEHKLDPVGSLMCVISASARFSLREDRLEMPVRQASGESRPGTKTLRRKYRRACGVH